MIFYHIGKGGYSQRTQRFLNVKALQTLYLTPHLQPSLIKASNT